eukprot:3483084-Pyramimonas_sp.AAC.1
MEALICYLTGSPFSCRCTSLAQIETLVPRIERHNACDASVGINVQETQSLRTNNSVASPKLKHLRSLFRQVAIPSCCCVCRICISATSSANHGV